MMPRMDTHSRFLGFCLFLGLLLAAAPAAPAACYGLAVGINTYNYPSGNPSSLTCCCADAIDMRKAFLAHGGGWTSASFTILTNAHASKTAIRKALTNLARKAVSGDTVVYYHSSHGGNANPALPSVFLCTYNADYTDEELASDLSLFQSGVKLLVMADTCFSGGLFTDDPSSQSMGGEGEGARLSPRAAAARTAAWDLAGRVTECMSAARAASSPSVASVGGAAASAISPEEIGWLTAAAYYQYSYENASVGHGYFTYYLLAAFDWGDADGDGALDFREMGEFAACRVPYFDQTPQFANLAVLEGATAAARGVSPTPAGDAWDYADARPNLSPTPIVPSSAELAHGPHTLRNLLDESDVFAFPVSALRPVHLWSTGATNLYADLHDSCFRLVRWEEESSQPGDFRLVVKPPADGTMYLKVYSGASADAYTLHCVQSPGEDTFPTLYPPATNAIDSLVRYELAAFRVVIPDGCTKLVATLSGPDDGDADLYVAQDFIATSSDETDWYSENNGNAERVAISRPAAGEWFVCVYAYEATQELTLVVTAEPEPLAATVPAELAGVRLDGGMATAEVCHPDLVPPPASLPVYAAGDLLAPVWTFLTNAPFADGVVTFPLPSAPVAYYAIGSPSAP